MKTREEKIRALNTAKAEAQRFIERADDAMRQLRGAHYEWDCRSTAYASAKRSSMDLTRSLVAIRR